MEDPNKCGWQRHTHARSSGKKEGERSRGKGGVREGGGREEQNKAKRNFFECKKEGCGPLEFDGRHVASSTRRTTEIVPGTVWEKGNAWRTQALLPNHESQRLSPETLVFLARRVEVEYRLPV